MEQKDMWLIEKSHFENGITCICGVDEAGRGPLAGPVCAAAVILPPNIQIPGLDDSKKLTDKRRRELFPVIKEHALAYGIAFADHKEIDQINILQATYLAMERAMNDLSVKPELALIDGNRAKDFGIPVQTVVKGDSLSASIAAASILAKTYRDDYMNGLHQEYPYYDWNKNKGYPTKKHRAAIREHGATPYHRMTFNLLGEDPQLRLDF